MLDGPDDRAAFRAEAAAWLDANCPAEMRDVAGAGEEAICWGGRRWTFASGAQRVWLERMVERRWTAPRWPVEYGGGGLTRAQEKVLREEMARIGARAPLESFGLWMLGPALLRFGSEAQKVEHLPPIARGEVRWCQGYSEPGAGSDLAGVQTKAEDAGDHWVVTGQKVWTSYADRADAIFALVRTDREAPKHEGISFVLIDMAAEGVSTRPIRLISGRSPFCETFFDGVRVPKANTVGRPGQGWEIAKYLLTHEREMIGGGARGLLGGRPLAAMTDDPTIRAEAMRADVDTLAFALTAERYADAAEGGTGVGDASAMLKVYGTELNKRRYELMMAAAGSDALTWEGRAGLAPEWLRSRANSIEGGTSEIMLGIIARRILGLPA